MVEKIASSTPRAGTVARRRSSTAAAGIPLARTAGGPAKRAKASLRLSEVGGPSLELLESIVPLLAQVIGPNCEVVLHDFSRLPNSIVAIGGDLTHRSVGGSINSFTLEKIRAGADRDFINYQVELPDGRTLRSSTVFIRNALGEATACLCFNFDVSEWLKIRSVLDAFTIPHDLTSSIPTPTSTLPTMDETFPNTVEDVMVETVSQAIARVGVSLDLMHKRHKIEVVKQLEERGLFLIRDAVDFVAKELRVTRYTIYNYLNEIKSEQMATPAPRRRRSE